MSQNVSTSEKMPVDNVEKKVYVLEKYAKQMQYYWTTSKRNKRAYKWMRYLTIVLGALTTLVASISSANFIINDASLKVMFAVATPILAAFLSIVGGMSQTFQWGAAWREMVLTAEHIEREYDRIRLTEPNKLDAESDLKLLNDKVIEESEGFFSRIIGGISIIKQESASQHKGRK